MADISVFANPEFDSKAWINTLCAQKPQEEALDRFLAEMEMRLQLAAEEIEGGLQDSSAQAMRRLPFAVQEIYRLQGDIQGMQDQVRVLSGRMASEASDSAACVVHLRQVDGVKRNMEAACATLREATELSGMFIKVEDVFASGDLPQVAALLRTMRASMAMVGDVPEFREGRVKLRQLEDRLQAQVEGALAAALNAPPGEGAAAAGGLADSAAEAHTRSLCDLLLAVDRYPTIESLYVQARVSRVQAMWDELSTTSMTGAAGAAAVGSWLPLFYAQLVPMLRSEVAWIGRVLPEQRTTVIPALLTAVLKKVNHGVQQRVSDRSVPIATLMSLSTDMAGTANAVSDVLPADLPAPVRADLLAQLLEPLEDAVRRYPSMEAAALEADVQAVLAPLPAMPPQAQDGTTAALDTDALMRQLWDAVRLVAASCCAAIDRCVSFTGGSELADIAAALDKVLVSLITRLSSHTDQAVARAGQAAAKLALQQQSGQGVHGMEEVGQEVGMGLRLVVLSSEVAGTALLRKVDAALRAALNTAVPRMEAAAAAFATQSSGASITQPHHGSTPPHVPASPLVGPAHGMGAKSGPTTPSILQHATVDLLSLRLGRDAQRLHKVQALARNLSEPRNTPLPNATQQADTWVRSMQSAAMDTLLARVRSALQPLPMLPHWRKRSDNGGAGSMMGLPSFSVEPLPYVTQLGDYLMYLPQQLEVLFSDELMASSMSQDEQDELAAHWLDRVVAGAAAAYAEAILRLQDLSPQGGVQLAADVEYFCNVMSALHVAPPSSLLTVQLFAGMPDAEFPGAAKAALADGGADAAALRTLAGQRQLQAQLT